MVLASPQVALITSTPCALRRCKLKALMGVLLLARVLVWLSTSLNIVAPEHIVHHAHQRTTLSFLSNSVLMLITFLMIVRRLAPLLALIALTMPSHSVLEVFAIARRGSNFYYVVITQEK